MIRAESVLAAGLGGGRALAVESVRAGELPKAPQIERPMIVGTARRSARS
jgi:hypothetical protein